MSLISIAILLLLFGGLILVFQGVRGRSGKASSLVATLVTLALLFVVSLRAQGRSGFATEEMYSWLPAIGLQFHFGVDGISAVFLMLTGIVFVMGVIASDTANNARYFGLLLLLECGLVGTFAAQNFIHFFLFWELALIPAFFLIRLHGGANSGRASIQFFIYTMVGSIAMLIGFLALFLGTGTFNLQELASIRPTGGFGSVIAQRLQWAIDEQTTALIVFLLVFLGIAVKVPLFPFHSWLPLTYTEAPTPVTMVLTGAMSKMGIYGLVRLVLPIFPEQVDRLHQPLLALAVITVLYGALAAFAQRDIKRLFAYSSLSHLGYCFLGVFAAAKAGVPGLENERAAAINGVLLQAISHGVIAAALFGCVSFLERRSGGLRGYESFGGMRKVNPVFAGLMGIALFSSLGLPGLSGFPAEFLIFKGAFPLAPVACAFAVVGLLLTALYLLTFYGRVFLGPLNESRAANVDLTSGERWVLAPALVVTLALGVAPQLLLAICNPAVTALVGGIKF